jgi:pimeloyl-ACP methyl ester carboxylesterase
MDKATVNGIELEYAVTGRGEPVLCISPVLADAFAPLAAEVTLGDYQVIRYHKRGWGGSTHTEGPVSVGDHAADAAALLDHFGIRHAHVLGHSSGAAVAAQLAIYDLDRVHSLSLLEPSLFSVPSGPAFLEQAAPVFETYASGDHATAVAMFLASVSGLEWSNCLELLESRVEGTVAQAIQDADTFFGVELPSLTQWVFGDAEAAQIRRPVLSIVGSETAPLWVEVAAFLRASLPYVEEREIDGVGHLLQLQDPRSVAAAVAEFLARNPMDAYDDARAPLPFAEPERVDFRR